MICVLAGVHLLRRWCSASECVAEILPASATGSFFGAASFVNKEVTPIVVWVKTKQTMEESPSRPPRPEEV